MLINTEVRFASFEFLFEILYQYLLRYRLLRKIDSLDLSLDKSWAKTYYTDNATIFTKANDKSTNKMIITGRSVRPHVRIITYSPFRYLDVLKLLWKFQNWQCWFLWQLGTIWNYIINNRIKCWLIRRLYTILLDNHLHNQVLQRKYVHKWLWNNFIHNLRTDL